MPYECLKTEATKLGVNTYELPLKNKGLYSDNVIWINNSLITTERTCVLAEELGHYHTTSGDILDQSRLNNRKQERRAREWAHNRLIPFQRIIDAHEARVKGRHEIAEFLGVTEEFLQESINRYMDKYGIFIQINDRFTIMLEPLSVIELLPS
ncbi:ImmA/IrrE family metallo-endopeptidase [Cohnella lupini]|uniref:Uncharacterized protein DUF955 n=1 Tax=Cohnella lupini TaxID=1294267 RepID=A0A3D9I0T5_9BACL|nr:ImmA/IrrE family metallo-endopeptidase [Cohnella lupini]RED54766.1 uncharacterized protein DUF955 [Cohnella lupini]